MGFLTVRGEYCHTCGFEQLFQELRRTILDAFPFTSCEGFPGRRHAFEVWVRMDEGPTYLAASNIATGKLIESDVLMTQLQDFMATGEPASGWVVENAGV